MIQEKAETHNYKNVNIQLSTQHYFLARMY